MTRKILALAGGLVLAVGLAAGGYWLTADGTSASEGPMADGAPAPPSGDVADAREMVVHMTPTCGCCGDWVDHMEEHGFEVEVEYSDDLRDVKMDNGVSPDLASCHTAMVGGYVVEGHVPAEDVIRFLEVASQETPDALGLAVPGMPIGSPGMEGAYEEDYDVLAFDGTGGTEVFASHP